MGRLTKIFGFLYAIAKVYAIWPVLASIIMAGISFTAKEFAPIIEHPYIMGLVGFVTAILLVVGIQISLIVSKQASNKKAFYKFEYNNGNISPVDDYEIGNIRNYRYNSTSQIVNNVNLQTGAAQQSVVNSVDLLLLFTTPTKLKAAKISAYGINTPSMSLHYSDQSVVWLTLNNIQNGTYELKFN